MHVDCRIHGTGVPNTSCGEFPTIWVRFDIQMNRDPNDKRLVHAQVTGCNTAGTTDGSKFGYRIKAYIGINDNPPSDDTILIDKPNTGTQTGWTSSIAINNPVYHFYTESSSVRFTIYVKNRDSCLYDNVAGHYCFNSGGDYCPIEDRWYTELPPATYTVSYDPNGGSPVPDSQTKNYNENLHLTSQNPTYPITINYYRLSGQLNSTTTANRQLTQWKDDAGRGFQVGGIYDLNEDDLLRAQWGYASFYPPVAPNEYFRVTFNYAGGTGPYSSVDLARPHQGYYNNPSYTGPNFPEGQQCQTTENPLNLYPKYGNATLTSLPTPTREGSIFKGWYIGNTQITVPYTVTASVTLTAKWIPLPIHIMQNGRWRDIGPNAYIRKNNAWTKADLTGADATRNHVWKANSSGNWEDKSV